jgi:hypothetical protein
MWRDQQGQEWRSCGFFVAEIEAIGKSIDVSSFCLFILVGFGKKRGMHSFVSPLSWSFPLPRPHTGVPLGNGTLGVLLWGTGNRLCLTISRAGFWDRRGGNPFLSKANFKQVRALLEAGDEAGLMTLFGRDLHHGSSGRPHQIGGGRLEIEFKKSWVLEQGTLDLSCGLLRVTLRKGTHVSALTLRVAVDAECGWMVLPPGVEVESIRLRPSWEWVGTELEKSGCVPPKTWQQKSESGFVQELPEDEPLAIVLQRSGSRLSWGTALGADAETAARAAAALPVQDMADRADAWWAAYWKQVPVIRLPDAALQEMLDFGLYMQACCTPPHGVPCALQGPFMEETRLPPWSNDYHFNINLQMIYTPAMATNRLEHFAPLWKLLERWAPHLRASGEAFFGEPGAWMLPHAVDDRCQVVGSFWTGSIDHACTAWMGLLCWDVCRYGRDGDLLRRLAWPLLRGAFAGYWAMAEDDGKGGLRLPVSVSPEYKGSRMDAWGVNASFQLAACHAVVRALRHAADWLGETIDPRWREMSEKLPPYASENLPVSAEYPEHRAERILLWQGQDLDASHRHHSHLGSITPFKTLDPQDPANAALLRHSLRAWQYRGAGAWSGWCVPWAASIHAHCREPDAAVFWLDYWRRLYTNEGRASLHDAAFPGVSNLDGSSAYWNDTAEIMQLDGRFGAITAIFDLLVQEVDGLIRVLPRLPRAWKDLSFRGLLVPGGFLLDAEVAGGRLTLLRVHSQHGGPLRLELPGGRRVDTATRPGQLLEFAIEP